ncbi:hypothetical protein GCM10022403_035450 [Streptomyces coacervatus]|uniref:Lipoprotein n=1 Tax=Streptomyces coacervatus TaxID=647381 RepID=A0ABP7HP97_9ACTN
MKRAPAAWAALAAAAALAGCSGHPADRVTTGAHPSRTASPAHTASALPVTASGTGLRLVAGTPVQFGADSTPGVAGKLVLTCRGEGPVRVQPSKGQATDVQCGGSYELQTDAGGTMFTASTTSKSAMTLSWTLEEMAR